MEGEERISNIKDLMYDSHTQLIGCLRSSMHNDDDIYGEMNTIFEKQSEALSLCLTAPRDAASIKSMKTLQSLTELVKAALSVFSDLYLKMIGVEQGNGIIDDLKKVLRHQIQAIHLSRNICQSRSIVACVLK